MSYWYALEQLGRFHQEQLLAEATHQRLIAAATRPVCQRRTRPLPALTAYIRAMHAALHECQWWLLRRRQLQVIGRDPGGPRA